MVSRSVLAGKASGGRGLQAFLWCDTLGGLHDRGNSRGALASLGITVCPRKARDCARLKTFSTIPSYEATPSSESELFS